MTRVACSAARVPIAIVVVALALTAAGKALVCTEVGMDSLAIMFVVGVFGDVDIIVVAVAVVPFGFIISYALDWSGAAADILIDMLTGVVAGDDTTVLAEVSTNVLAAMASSFKFDMRAPSESSC